MNAIKIVAIALILAGTLGLVYGGFSYIQSTHRADVGPLHLQVDERHRVDVPLWLSIAAVAGGLFLLVTARKR